MKKLTLSLLLSSALLSGKISFAGMIDGYQALSSGDQRAAYAFFLEEAKDNPQALFVLGMMNYEGIGISQDLIKTESLLKQAAKAGSLEAQYNLAILRLDGELHRASLDDVFSQLMDASEKGLDAATVRLGIALIENEGEPHPFFTPERVKALYQQLEKSFNTGNGFAGFILGIYWAEAERFGLEETNCKIAIELLEESFEKGFLPASIGLAALYSEGGYGVPANPDKAEKYQAIVFENLGMIRSFDDLLPGVLNIYSMMTPAEQKEIITQLQKDAKSGSVSAIVALIQRYEIGNGVAKSSAKVEQYLLQLEALDTAESLYALGKLSLKQNETLGKHYIEAAAAKDYIPAIQWLSQRKNHEWNTEESVIAAYELQGANLGDVTSIHAVIHRLYQEIQSSGWWSDEQRPVGLIAQEIYEWTQKLQNIAPEDVKTHLQLASIYELGIGTEMDLEKAFASLMQAYQYAPDNEELLLSLAVKKRDGTGTAQDFAASAQYYLQAKAQNDSITALDGLIYLNQLTIGFKGNQALQSQILGITLDEYANQNQYFTILDCLLDELEIAINESHEASIYAYLLADRYFSQYLQFNSTIKTNPENAEVLIEQRDQLLKQAIQFYENAYDQSEQAKLHYVEALKILRENSKNSLAAQNMAIDARKTLMRIDSLATSPKSIPDNDPRYLTEKERIRALKQAVLLLDDSEDFQRWFGEEVLSYHSAAMELLQDMIAEQGDHAPIFALYYLGSSETANGNASGYDRIVLAANQGYLPAIYHLAKAYYDENALLINYLGGSKQSAITWYEKGAALNDEESIYQLGELYLENKIGLDLPASKGDLKAISYYEHLQDPDYRFAKFHLNDAKERVAAYQDIQQRLKAQDPEAFYQQSSIYRYGEYGEQKDEIKAEAYLLQAADMGYLPAMKNYYDRYWNDSTITGETLERFNRYHIGYVHGAKGDWETQRLADRYLKGDRIPENRAKAREYYEFALQNDPDSSASYDLGYMNRFDQNLPLAKTGNAEAMLVIGRAYDTGNGIKQNPEKAYEWLEKSANAGNRDAAFYFGVSAQEGIIAENGEIIIAPDWETALKWYEQASERFKHAISGRIEAYETLYLPAEKGDAKAMVGLADKYASDYRSRDQIYDLNMAKSWYEKALEAGELSAHFGMMQLLPKSEQSAYLQTLLDSAGDASFNIQLSKAIRAQDEITPAQLQLAVNLLVAVATDESLPANIRQTALAELLLSYHRSYRLENGEVISAPDFEENQALALRYSQEFPAMKRIVADALYQQDDLENAMTLWQGALDAGDYAAALRLFRQTMPGSYDTVNLADLTRLEQLYEQYLTLVPEYPIGPDGYTEFIKTYDIEGVLDNEDRAEMSEHLGLLWQKNGHDFIADIERSRKWYQHALDRQVTKDRVNTLLHLTEELYASNPDNLRYLAELYLYSAIYGEPEKHEYPFEKLTDLQKLVLEQQVIAYQDERDYGRDKWVMIAQQKRSDAGDAKAALSLGDNYRYGRNTRQNLAKAIEYYELAGSRGDAVAYNRLGNMFRKDEDENIAPDYPRALAYFAKGAALGDSNTAHLAGDMLYFGEGDLEKDYVKAAEYYAMTDLAQGNHHALAKYKQAEILYQGLIAPPTLEDYQQAFDLMMLAMKYGEERAAKALATWDFSMLLPENLENKVQDIED